MQRLICGTSIIVVCSKVVLRKVMKTWSGVATELAGLESLLCRIVKQLQDSKGYMWLGGGEINLKLGFDVADFIRAYKPLILDCTYDD